MLIVISLQKYISYSYHVYYSSLLFTSTTNQFRFKLEFKEIPNVSDTLWLPNPSNPLELIPDTK